MKRICDMTAIEISTAIKNKELSSKDTVLAFLEEIENNNKALNCFNFVNKEAALKRADEIQKSIDNGSFSGNLAGVPIAIKDNISTKGIRTTCSSKMLDKFIPTYSATVIDLLEKEGAIIIGKLNMDEFAMGSTTETSYFGATKNAWDNSKSAGGSSGGSANCVCAKMSPISLGTDTGGSIRQPCSYCGVCGLKPTYGTVSRYGLIAYASSFDQIGPIAKNVDDCALIYSIISKEDKKDSTCKGNDFNISRALSADIKGKKIGIPKEFLSGEIGEEIKSAILNSAEIYKSLGAEIEEFSMPILKYSIPAYYIIACAQASSNLARYDGIKYGFCDNSYDDLEGRYIKSRSNGFGLEVKRRLMLGNFVLSTGYYDAYYKKALKIKDLIKKEFDEIFKKYDVILSPVAPTTATKLGEEKSALEMYLGDIFTVPVNLAGLPAFALPCGFDKDNMPIGMQIIGNSFCEEEIMSFAKAFQNVTDFHKQFPKLEMGGAEE